MTHQEFDFGGLFATEEYRPIEFRVRAGADGRHDAIYLGSYLHDATFQLGNVQRDGKRLRIRLTRDTWEIYQRTNQLLQVKCELTVEPVASVRWQFEKSIADSLSTVHERSLMIDYTVIDSRRKTAVLVLENQHDGFEVRIVCSDSVPSICLRDGT